MKRQSLFTIVRNTYEGGMCVTREEAQDVGDSLFTFAVNEFAEEGLSVEDSLKRCDTAIRQLQEIRDGIARGRA